MFKKVYCRYISVIILIVTSVISLCCLTSGCLSTTNPTPNYYVPSVVSYDEYGNATAGLLGVDGHGNFIITKHAVDKYNSLIEKYGELETPVLKKNDGISKYINDNNESTEYYIITPQYFYVFAKLSIKENQVIKSSTNK